MEAGPSKNVKSSQLNDTVFYHAWAVLEGLLQLVLG